MLMVCKNRLSSNAPFMIELLKLTSPDFDRLCDNVSEIQRLTQSGTRGHGHKKAVHLPSVDSSGTFHGKCRNCRKVCVYWSKEYKQSNGMTEKPMAAMGAIPAMMAPTRCAFFAV